MQDRKNKTGIKKIYQWESEALCHLSSSSHLFFPPTNIFETSKLRRKRETKAKTICNACTVNEKCLEYALKHDWLDGVWGGTNPKERAQQRILNQ